MGRRTDRGRTPGLWIATNELPSTGGHPFYQRLNRILDAHGFDDFVEAHCAPFYAASVGRPSLTPGTYFRLLLIGYFEGIDSERGIAWRTADSLALRGFLGLGLDEATPEHSTISPPRRLIDLETHRAVFTWILQVLATADLVQGKTIGIDATTLEANAALRSIVRRDSGETYQVGFVETDTENEKVLTPFLRSLVERGLDVSQGLLVVLDGGKGLRAAVRKAFRHRALVQRCQWHKRENVVSYLAKREHASWRQRLQRAYNRPTYDEAVTALTALHRELEHRNQSAARSLAEGLNETLTLHRLGLYGVLGRSLKTTNGLESVNALVEERCAKVDHWQNSSQRHRWLATALLDIEPRLRKVMGYRHLPTLRVALKAELKIDTTPSEKEAA